MRKTNRLAWGLAAVLACRTTKFDPAVNAGLFCLIASCCGGFLAGQYWFPHTQPCRRLEHLALLGVLERHPSFCGVMDFNWGLIGTEVGQLPGLLVGAAVAIVLAKRLPRAGAE